MIIEPRFSPDQHRQINDLPPAEVLAKDRFTRAYRLTLEGCYSCHKASDKPYLRPRIPEQPASRIINFDPAATWP